MTKRELSILALRKAESSNSVGSDWLTHEFKITEALAKEIIQGLINDGSLSLFFAYNGGEIIAEPNSYTKSSLRSLTGQPKKKTSNVIKIISNLTTQNVLTIIVIIIGILGLRQC